MFDETNLKVQLAYYLGAADSVDRRTLRSLSDQMLQALQTGELRAQTLPEGLVAYMKSYAQQIKAVNKGTAK